MFGHRDKLFLLILGYREQVTLALSFGNLCGILESLLGGVSGHGGVTAGDS